MSASLSVHFEDIDIGQVIGLGAVAVSEEELSSFVRQYFPGWDEAYGLPDALIYVLWSRLWAGRTTQWAGYKVLAVDGVRYMRNPPAGELLRGRVTVLGKDPVGDAKGVVISQQDLLDEAGRLVFSCMTRGLVTRQ